MSPTKIHGIGVPLAAREREQKSLYMLRRQFLALFFMFVHVLSGKASYGSITMYISVFIRVLSPDIYMQFLVLVKTVLRKKKKKEIKKLLHTMLIAIYVMFSLPYRRGTGFSLLIMVWTMCSSFLFLSRFSFRPTNLVSGFCFVFVPFSFFYSHLIVSFSQTRSYES